MSAAQKKKRNTATRTAWTVVAIIAVLAVGLVVALFVLAKGGGPTPAPTTTSSASASPTETASPTPTPTASADSLEQVQTKVTAIVAARNAPGLVAYMGDSIQYINFGSDGPEQTLTPAAAADQLKKNIGTETWGVADPDMVSGWKASPFSSYFPDGSLQLISNKDHFLSFIFDANNRIVQVVYGTGASLS